MTLSELVKEIQDQKLELECFGVIADRVSITPSVWDDVFKNSVPSLIEGLQLNRKRLDKDVSVSALVFHNGEEMRVTRHD